MRHDIDELKQDIEDNRLQLELINQSMAELQVSDTAAPKPRRQIGFIQEEKEEGEEGNVK